MRPKLDLEAKLNQSVWEVLERRTMISNPKTGQQGWGGINSHFTFYCKTLE